MNLIIDRGVITQVTEITFRGYKQSELFKALEKYLLDNPEASVTDLETHTGLSPGIHVLSVQFYKEMD